jgi:glycosyltransferase involved in cell wall biosynthesis
VASTRLCGSALGDGGAVDDRALSESSGVAAPLVTVAIPTYKRPVMLRSAIESALSQTYTNMEILVSDSEASAEIAALVAGFGDPRLRYRDNGQETDGLENALNMYRAARGELVATLHDDDEWDPRFLEVMVAPLLANPDVALTFADHWIINAEGHLLVDRTEAWTRARGRAGLAEGIYQPFTELALVYHAVFFVAATVFRNGLVDWDEVPPEVAPPYELWMAYLACRDGEAAYYVPERLMRYRVHETTATRTSRLEQAHVYCYDRWLEDDRVKDLTAELERSAAVWRASLGLSLLADENVHVARRHLLRAFRHGARLNAAFGLGLSLLPRSARGASVGWIRGVRARRDLANSRTPAMST